MGTGNWERGRRGLGALAVGVGGANGERGPADGPGGPERGRRPASRRPSSVVRRPDCIASGAGRRHCLSVLLIAISHFLCPHSPHAQTARLAVLADSATAGEPFDVSVTVRHRPGQQVAFPEVPAGAPEARLRIGDGEAVSVRRFPPAVRGSVRVDSAVYRVVTFAADAARVGPVAVTVRGGGETAAVETGTARVPVRSVLRGEAPPYEPAPVGPADPFPSATPLWVLLGALAAFVTAGAAWAVFRFARRPRDRAAVAPYPAALGRLAALERESPDTAEAVERHVVALRATLRAYLADRLALPAREATTAEIDGLLAADARVPTEAAEAVRRALRPTDLVAFARVRPRAEVVRQLGAQTREAVEAVEEGMRKWERGTEQAPASGTVAAGEPPQHPTPGP